MSECINCRRPLPDTETLFGGKCRLCARLKDHPWAKATLPTPDTTPKSWVTCARCKGPKATSEHNSYCPPCWKIYQRQRRAKLRRLPAPLKKIAVALDAVQPAYLKREAMKDMPGVDIDAIHYKRGMVRKKAA